MTTLLNREKILLLKAIAFLAFCMLFLTIAILAMSTSLASGRWVASP